VESSSSVADSSSSSSSGFPESPNKDINRRVAAVTVIAALSLFVSTRLDFGISLKDLTASALPYEEVCFWILHLCFYSHRMLNEFCEWIFRRYRMGSRLLLSSMQIGVKFVEN
jgi:hypothetical protein